MTRYLRTCGGHTMTVHAPRPGELDPAALAAFTAAEPVLGLDVETSAIDDHGPRFFAPGFTVRLVQFGSEREAWVLDMADPGQRDAAAAVLADPARRFVTHTPFDVLAVWSALGIPLGQRVADTHLLSKLLDPDERAGHGLKELSARHLDGGLTEAEIGAARPDAGTGPGRAPGREHAGCGGAGTTCPPTMRHTSSTPGWTPSTPAACCRSCSQRARRSRTWRGWIPGWPPRPPGSPSAGCGWTPAIPAACWPTWKPSTPPPTRGSQPRSAAPAGHPGSLNGSMPSPQRRASPALPAPRPAGFKSPPTPSPNCVADHAAMAALPAGAADLITARLAMSKASNLIANLRGFLTAADPAGRVHPQVNTLRAKTARMSITNPALQTLKKHDPRLRRCFTADPGHVLISCDFSQVEIRVAAALAEDPTLREVILSGADIHDATAALMYGEGFTDEQRTISKRATFGTIYGGGARALASQTGVTRGHRPAGDPAVAAHLPAGDRLRASGSPSWPRWSPPAGGASPPTRPARTRTPTTRSSPPPGTCC